MNLFYHLWNRSETTEKMVLLHGMGGTGVLWRPIAASLEEKMAILAPDQRGHGRSRISSEQPGYTPKDYAQDVIDTLEVSGFYPTWILGHSMGVRTAVAAAHIKPSWVRGLILVDLGFSGVAGGGLGEGLADFLRRLPLNFSSPEEAKSFMKMHCPDPSIGQYLMAVSVRTPQGEVEFPFDHSALIQTIEAARDFSVRPWVHELAVLNLPILVLRGGQSLVWSFEEFAKEREEFKEESTVVFKEINQAGHGLPFEQRPLFLKTIQDFISNF